MCLFVRLFKFLVLNFTVDSAVDFCLSLFILTRDCLIHAITDLGDVEFRRMKTLFDANPCVFHTLLEHNITLSGLTVIHYNRENTEDISNRKICLMFTFADS